MNWDIIEGNWGQIKGKFQEQWSRFTDDDFDAIDGRRDQLAGKIRERYSLGKDDAEQQIDNWKNSARDDWFEKRC